MTVTTRVRLVLALAIAFYSAIIAAGTAGFDPIVWLVATMLFILWHLLMHPFSPAAHWPIILFLHTVIAALCLGLGHGLGVVTGVAVDPVIALSVALGATTIARIIDRAAGSDGQSRLVSRHDQGEDR